MSAETPQKGGRRLRRELTLEYSKAHPLGMFIFGSRWLQAPIYVGLVIAQAVYVIVFIVDLLELINRDVMMEIAAGRAPDEAAIMLGVLALIDVAMIANLLIMVIVGGYETFVSRIDLNTHRDQPDWLSHVNENVLKVKLGMAIIGISSIHLLKSFVEVTTMKDGIAAHSGTSGIGTITGEGALWQVVIHMAFVVSAIILAWIDRMQVTASAKVQLQHAEAEVLLARAEAIRSKSRDEHEGKHPLEVPGHRKEHAHGPVTGSIAVVTE